MKLEKNGNKMENTRKIKGVCLYCLGCNRLENYEFKGVHNCSGFVPGYSDWHDRYMKDLRRGCDLR